MTEILKLQRQTDAALGYDAPQSSVSEHHCVADDEML